MVPEFLLMPSEQWQARNLSSELLNPFVQ